MLTYTLHQHQKELMESMQEWKEESCKKPDGVWSLTQELTEAFNAFMESMKAGTRHFHRELEGSLSSDVGLYWGIVDRECLFLGPKRNPILQAVRVANFHSLAEVFYDDTNRLINRFTTMR